MPITFCIIWVGRATNKIIPATPTINIDKYIAARSCGPEPELIATAGFAVCEALLLAPDLLVLEDLRATLLLAAINISPLILLLTITFEAI